MFRELRPHMHLSAVLAKLATTPDVETEELEHRTSALDNFVKAVRFFTRLYAPYQGLILLLDVQGCRSSTRDRHKPFGCFTKGADVLYAIRITDPEIRIIPLKSTERGFNDRASGRELVPREDLAVYETYVTLATAYTHG